MKMKNTNGLKARNATETQIMEITTRCHDWLAKELDLESNMSFGRVAVYGSNASYVGTWRNTQRKSLLNFRNLYGASVRDMIQTIGHEARHSMQYRDGTLKQNGKKNRIVDGEKIISRIWEGETWTGPYIDAPWEIDARAFQGEYAQMIIDSGIVSEEELNIVLPRQPHDLSPQLKSAVRAARKVMKAEVSAAAKIVKAVEKTEERDEARKTKALINEWTEAKILKGDVMAAERAEIRLLKAEIKAEAKVLKAQVKAVTKLAQQTEARRLASIGGVIRPMNAEHSRAESEYVRKSLLSIEK